VRLLLFVVVGAVFVSINYLVDLNQELLVRSKIENSVESLSFSEEFIRELASLESAKPGYPDTAISLPDSFIGRPLITKKLIQSNGEEFNFELKVKLKRKDDKLVQLVGDRDGTLVFYTEKPLNPLFPIELINIKTNEKLLVQVDIPQKISPKLVEQKVSLKSFSNSKKQVKKGLRSFEGELDVYQAIIPKFSKAPLRGAMVSGAISVNAGSLESLDLEVTNQRGEVKEISFNYSEIKDGGVFSFDDNGSEAFGILTNDGDHGLRVRFSTGSFAGAVVSFGNGGNSNSIRLPKEEIIKLNERARADFKKRALSNEFVKESQIRF